MKNKSKPNMMVPLGKVLISSLEELGVDIVFGIPGVHTVELYRYLSNSTIRHITPRHEQGAGFMADGYARVAGNPGVCFLITGPGLTNALTPMAQARADSIPLVVISTINPPALTRSDYGRLHELPDQTGLLKKLAVYHHRLDNPERLPEVLNKAFTWHLENRPGPIHLEIPLDVITARIKNTHLEKITKVKSPSAKAIPKVVEACLRAEKIAMIAGGGATRAGDMILQLAERLDAPLVTTINARGIGKGNALSVPASPSLQSTRKLLEAANLVLALGTEFGPTDFEIYKSLPSLKFKTLIRVDIDETQLARGPAADISICSEVGCFVEEILVKLPTKRRNTGGKLRVKQCIQEVKAQLSSKELQYIEIIQAIQEELPGCYLIGDSTQISYAGNLYCQIYRDNGWFNAATGYGALGYSLPASIGASLADSQSPVVCLVGDGGLQFTLTELGAAVDEEVPVIFIVFNNHGYGEIKSYMEDQGIVPIGVNPTPPNIASIAQAYGLPYGRVQDIEELISLLRQLKQDRSPQIIEYLER